MSYEQYDTRESAEQEKMSRGKMRGQLQKVNIKKMG